MANSPYDYIQIVDDNDWQLVGIIPKNNKTIPHESQIAQPNEALSRSTQSFNKQNVISPSNMALDSVNLNTSTPKDFSPFNNKIPNSPLSLGKMNNMEANLHIEEQSTTPKPVEATIVNRRRPVNRIIMRGENSSKGSYTPGQLPNVQNKNISVPLITPAESSIQIDRKSNINPNVLTGIETLENASINDLSDQTLFGEISNLAVLGRDNLLVGFGK
ncbi:Hypothetical protein HVR_LOCUS1178 [uncultured virus]|nr:Hypothetical protein HVR_LOCUS1178 [uncultured virus]